MARGSNEFEGTGDEPVSDGGGTSGVVDPASIGIDRSDDGGDFVYDPERHIGPDKRNRDGSYRRKRGRKSGGGQRAGAKATAADIKAVGDQLSVMLAFLHDGIAAATKTPELELDAGEAAMLGQASANVLAELELKPNPLHTAVFGLITASATVYAPRVVAIRARKAREEKRPQVVTFPGGAF